MTQTAINYAKALYELSISPKAMEEMEAIVVKVPEVLEVLESPIVSGKEKHRLIEKLFPKETRAFLKLLCDQGRADQLYGICQAYRREYKRKNHLLDAEVFSADTLTEEEKQKTEDFIRGTCPGMTCEVHYKLKPELLGGTLIRIGNVEYDSSYRGRLRQLEQKLTGRWDV